MILLMAEDTLLGLDLTEFLLHLLNLLVLLVGLTFLLYKPIKKFMNTRSEKYLADKEESLKAAAEAEEWKKKRLELIKAAEAEAQSVIRDAKKQAGAEAEEIIQKAKKDANDILEKGYNDLNRQKEQMQEELAESVSELAVGIAAQLIKREFKAEDNDALITSVLEKVAEQDENSY